MSTFGQRLKLARDRYKWIESNIYNLKCKTLTKKYFGNIHLLDKYISARSVVDYILQWGKPYELACYDENEEPEAEYYNYGEGDEFGNERRYN